MPDSRGYRHPFNDCTYYLGGVGDNPRTLAELAMAQFSAELRRKHEWWRHFKAQRDDWAHEACDRVWLVMLASTAISEVVLNSNQINYVLDELAGYSALLDVQNRCQVSCFERVWESDHLLESDVLAELDLELATLKDDDHSLAETGASQRDIIDPTCCPLIYDQTCLFGHKTSIPPPIQDLYSVSHRFALLPTEIQISSSRAIKFLSYINNLHPSYNNLHDLLRRLLSRFIPLFEHTLTDLHRTNPIHQRIPGRSWYSQWEEPEPPEHSDDETGWETYEKEMWAWMSTRPINFPDVPKDGYPGALENRRHVVSLTGRRAQVIIGASEIYIPPFTTEPRSECWRVQGMKNERIAASGFYYTSVDNLRGGSLDFRMAVTFPRGFNAGDNGATLRTWGLRDADPCHQYIGSVAIRDGLAVVFPNIYQFRHSSYALVDSTKEGRARLVYFLLVDPDINPILSTASIGPQQRHWINQALLECLHTRLPRELIEHITSFVDWVMDDDEIRDVRKLLLAERTDFIAENDQHYFSIPFDIYNGPDVLLYA